MTAKLIPEGTNPFEQKTIDVPVQVLVMFDALDLAKALFEEKHLDLAHRLAEGRGVDREKDILGRMWDGAPCGHDDTGACQVNCMRQAMQLYSRASTLHVENVENPEK